MSPPKSTTLLSVMALLLALATGSFIALRASHKPVEAKVHRVVTAQPKPTAAPDSCAPRIKALLHEPALPRPPLLDQYRGEILARSKANPILFLREPRSPQLSDAAKALRDELFQSTAPWKSMSELLKRTNKTPRLLREVLLRDGYLYADSPALAVLISSAVSLNQLFSESDLVLTRGSATYRVKRKREEYVWAEGPQEGESVKLWLFDRIHTASETPTEDSHVSVIEVRERLGADRITVKHLTAHAMVADVEYGDVTVQTLFTLRERQASFDCESIAPEQREPVLAHRARSIRKGRVVEILRRAIDEQVDEALPFDEPKTEEGQQDGKLRQEWRDAYLLGKQTFTFNGDDYPVFDQKGRPRTPQVCADFITDTLERMADTRYLPRSKGRKRQIGRLDLDTLEIENRRSVESLMSFASQHPEWFELLVVPESERIAFSNRRAFFERLQTLHNEFTPGDVVAILGYRDDEKLHYHSFYIVSDDPITGIPTWVAANAGRPRIRSFEGEMQNAPRRSIYGRIRPRLDWLEAIAGLTTTAVAPLLGAPQ